MAPKSDASILAKVLKDNGMTRPEALLELQEKYPNLSKSRRSQLLSEHWGDSTAASSSAMPKKEDAGKNEEGAGELSDSSTIRAKHRLSSKRKLDED